MNTNHTRSKIDDGGALVEHKHQAFPPTSSFCAPDLFSNKHCSTTMSRSTGLPFLKRGTLYFSSSATDAKQQARLRTSMESPTWAVRWIQYQPQRSSKGSPAQEKTIYQLYNDIATRADRSREQEWIELTDTMLVFVRATPSSLTLADS
jgi:hypothetical protein